MPALVLVAVSLGLSNFAAAIGIGVSGIDVRTRLKVGAAFGMFEAGLPIAGLALGHGLADVLGSAARWTGAALLIGTDPYGGWQARGGGEDSRPDAAATGGRGMGRLWLRW